MKTKYVSETKAGKSIQAWIILNRRNKPVATVRAHHSDGGACLVNVFSFDAATPFQHATASGWGYDKLTAALAGLTIDGHKLTNHCEGSKKMPHGGWPRDAKPPRGWHFANFVYRDSKGEDLPVEKQHWSSCYRESGLDYLKALGYKVIQAI